jgi:molybdopterin converting factor small subunit
LKVLVASPLHSYTGGRASVEAEGATLDAVLRDLDRRFPGLRFRIIDEQDRIRPHIKLFVDAEQTFDLSTRVPAAGEVAIVQAFSGG